jgi:UDP-N-acetyl-2-amino-2-deoxyglucuronate dehydrogenase
LTVFVGLIGAGNISDTHARALGELPGAEIAAVYAPDAARAERFTARYGGTPHDSLEQMLAQRPLDMVVIGTPSGLHADHGTAAAVQGLHVLVEKPIDVTTARTDALIRAAADAAVTLGVIFQDRLKPDVRRMKALVDRGRLGTPILANARVKWYRPPSYYRDSRWRGTRSLDGGGALMNQGVHTVDLLLWMFGPVRRVFARTIAGLHAVEVEDTAVAVLEFANGAIGTLEAATSAYPGYSRQIELTGSNGTLRLDGDDLVGVDLKDTQEDERPAPAGRVTASAASPVVSDPSAHVRVFEDFMRAVATRTAPCCDGAGARQSVALIEAVYHSARTNLPVNLP